jgi:hypothetical protein
MTKSTKSDWPHIESALHKLEKPEFIELLQQLSEVSAEAANFLTARFHGEKTREEILAPYRAIIGNPFFHLMKQYRPTWILPRAERPLTTTGRPLTTRWAYWIFCYTWLKWSWPR